MTVFLLKYIFTLFFFVFWEKNLTSAHIRRFFLFTAMFPISYFCTVSTYFQCDPMCERILHANTSNRYTHCYSHLSRFLRKSSLSPLMECRKTPINLLHLFRLIEFDVLVNVTRKSRKPSFGLEESPPSERKKNRHVQIFHNWKQWTLCTERRRINKYEAKITRKPK